MKVFTVWAVCALAFVALLAGAIGWDAVRELRSAHTLVLDNDREVRLQEERFLNNLTPVGINTEDVQAEKIRFQQAQTTVVREAAFQDLLVRIGRLNPTAPGDPVARRAADEYAGALNRRQIAVRRYQEAAAEYNAASQTWTGKLARRFSALPEQIAEH
jgi:hypothetical protein